MSEGLGGSSFACFLLFLQRGKRNTTTKEGYNRSLSLLRRRRLILDPVCLAGGGGEGHMRVFYSLQSQASSPSSSFEMHVYGRTGAETIVAGGPPIHFDPHTLFSQRFINFRGGESFLPCAVFFPFFVRGEIERIRRFIPFHSGMRIILLAQHPLRATLPLFFDLTHFIHPRHAATTILGRNSPNFDTFLLIPTLTLFREMVLIKKSSLVYVMCFVGSFIQATKVGRQVKQCIDCC